MEVGLTVVIQKTMNGHALFVLSHSPIARVVRNGFAVLNANDGYIFCALMLISPVSTYVTIVPVMTAVKPIAYYAAETVDSDICINVSEIDWPLHYDMR